jgi:hypothetical protein
MKVPMCLLLSFSLVAGAIAHMHEMPPSWMHAEPWTVDNWTTVEHGESLHKGEFPVNTTKYISPTIHLMTGEAHFSLNPLTHVPFPKGDYSIIEFNITMVNAKTNKPTSLAEVYNHHWLLGTADSVNVLEPCEKNLFLGGGAEFRGMPGVWGDRAIVRIGARGYCGANLHFIRTEDLKTHWTGLNDPKGNYGAAVKNCMECGYAPGRAPFGAKGLGICSQALDGFFSCCFDGSRCPVNNPLDGRKKGYRLQYEVKWTRDLFAKKAAQSGVLDVGNGAVEWNVGPFLNKPPISPLSPGKRLHQICNATVCNTTHQFPVMKAGAFDQGGLCPGSMIGSYLHMHAGAIRGEMYVNGKYKCSSTPRLGTVPGKGPESVGNEKGYTIGFSFCVDPSNPSEAVRLNHGDIVTITGLYDVNVKSSRNLPLPGGKHGGIMMLFFYQIDCDPGTYPTEYVCRQNKCLATVVNGDFKNETSCKQACGHHADTFACANRTCVADPSGVPLKTCQAACGVTTFV